jgi:hypothetical protein
MSWRSRSRREDAEGDSVTDFAKVTRSGSVEAKIKIPRRHHRATLEIERRIQGNGTDLLFFLGGVGFFLGVVQEGKLDSGGQQVEKLLFLFLLLDTERLAWTAATGAQLEELPTPTPQAMHTGVAHDFPAFSALIRDTGPGMARTNQRAIGQHYRGSWGFDGGFILRDLDFYVGILNEQFDVPDCEVLSGSKCRFLDRLPLNKGTVCRITITQEQNAVAELDFAVKRGNSRMLDSKIVIRAAP